MKQDKWTQQLRDKLAEHETAAPPDLWADIEAALPPQPRRARLVALRRWAAAAAVVALLGGGGLVWWNKQQQPEPMLSQAESGALLPHPTVEEQLVAQTDVAITKEKVEQQNTVVTAKHRTLAITDSADGKTTPVDTQPETVSRKETDAENEPDTSTHAESTRTEPTIPYRRAEEIGTDHRPTTKRTPSVAMYATNGFSTHSGSNAVFMSEDLTKRYANTFTQAASRQAPIFLTDYAEQQHHSQPVSFGLSLSYPFSDRMALLSGIVYTRLHAEFTQSVRSMQYSKEQTLHYVGVPLGLTYNLLRYNGMTVYLSAAMQADWNVYARTETEGVRQDTDRDRMQWSASASLGMQYNITSQLSLYAEPCISHYFDNGSNVQNFFKDKPNSLKLQAGLRLNLK